MTTPARTAFDLGRRLSRENAVVVLDALCAATGLRTEEVIELSDLHPGARGIARLREVLPLVDGGAESPQESRTRLLLIDNGLPRPETQIVVRDHYGTFVARVDIGWEQWKVAVEYDGAQHWTDPAQRSKDIDRHAELNALGWLVIRVSADQLRTRPHIILDRVRTALRTQGAHLIA
ncbi:endonuclease domain-containing protein [Nocardia sp. CA-120079]|uniref:endonuclease domain-containing protein n=1 Tax=Nocardia sp. CA-120079 TaxID=3239974 RepID=UPI003D984481